jgi:hypothetical protein
MRVMTLSHAIAGVEMELKQVVLVHLDEIFSRFIANTDPPDGTEGITGIS